MYIMVGASFSIMQPLYMNLGYRDVNLSVLIAVCMFAHTYSGLHWYQNQKRYEGHHFSCTIHNKHMAQ